MMSNEVWPVTLTDYSFAFDKPIMIKQNKFMINGMDLVVAFEKYPQLYCFMIDNKEYLDSNIVTFIDGISEKFYPEIPIGSLGRIKTAATEWQEQDEHRYVRLELIDCNNYNGYILPFHDPEHQYGFFFINIEKSLREDKLILYWEREKEPAPNASYEEHIWTSHDGIELIATNDDDAKDKEIGLQRMFVKFYKNLCNERLDEIEESSSEIFKILLKRLRGKCRVGAHGKIVSVQGTISKSARETIEDKITDIVDEDEKFNEKNKNVISYKLSRSKLFGGLQINAVYLVRIFDSYGKELKLLRSISNCDLYDESAIGYTRSLKSLAIKINKKYIKTGKTMDSITAFNGIRITFNSNKIKLTTNTFSSTFGKIDKEKAKFPVIETLGRKGGW